MPPLRYDARLASSLIRARIIYSATCTLVTILNGQGNHKDSDFDIYVVIPDDSMRPIEAMQKTGRALSRKDIRAVDVIVGKETVFNQRKGLPTTERAIARDGVKLYG